MEYCQSKVDSGRFADPAKYNPKQAPTYSLIERKELAA